MSQIRKVVKPDLAALKVVLDTSGLFPSHLLEDMITDFFINPTSEDMWLTKEINTVPIALCYYAPERLAIGTYNLYLIAVHKDYQGQGIGGEMISYVEKLLGAKGKRILLVETSGLPEFELTRKFYDKCHYTREAVIRDFYREGEDKVVFWKKLTEITG